MFLFLLPPFLLFPFQDPLFELAAQQIGGLEHTHETKSFQ